MNEATGTDAPATLAEVPDLFDAALRAISQGAHPNHDVGGKGYEEHVTAPFTSGNKLYYSFDKENAHFIALAIDEVSDYSPKSAQYRWLVADFSPCLCVEAR